MGGGIFCSDRPMASTTAAHSMPSGNLPTSPPPRRGVGASWLFLLLCLLAAAVGLLTPWWVGHDPVDPAEIRTLDLAWQTWQSMRQTALGDWSMDNLIPVHQGRLTPWASPGLVWVDAVLFEVGQRFVGPEPLTPGQMIALARSGSLGLALVALVSVFWAGRSLTNNLTASLGTLVLGSLPFFVMSAHSASPQMAVTSLSLLSVALGLWATRPLRPSPTRTRQALGWVGCGLALAAAMLVGGPSVLWWVAMPIFVMLVICPGRLGHLLGLLVALLLAAILLTPWAIHLHEKNPDTWRHWLGAIAPSFLVGQSMATVLASWVRQAGWVLMTLLPWTLWLLGAILQPFSPSSKGSRTRLFLSWGWFIAVVTASLLLGESPSGISGSAGVTMGVGAVLLGQLFTQYSELASLGRFAKFWGRLQWPHLALVLAGSICLPLFLAVQPMLKEPWCMALAWPLAVSLGVGLLTLAFLSLRWIHRGYPARAMIAWAAWAMLGLAVVGPLLAAGPLGRSGVKQEAKLLKELTDGHRLFMLAWVREPNAPARRWPEIPLAQAELQIYAQRSIRGVSLFQLDELVADQGGLFLLIPREAQVQPPSNWTQRQTLSHSGLVLYHLTSP